jgi:hypothetical protein
MSQLITLVLETLKGLLSNDPSLPAALQCLPSLLATAQGAVQALEKDNQTLRKDTVEAKTVLYEMTCIQQDTKKALEDAREEIRGLKASLEAAEGALHQYINSTSPSSAIGRGGGGDSASPPIEAPPTLPQSQPSASLEAAEALALEATARLSASERARAQAEGECSYWRARAGRAEVLLSGEQGVVKAQREALELADCAGEARLREAEGRFARASVRWEKGRVVEALLPVESWDKGEEEEEEEEGLEGRGHFDHSRSGADTSGITSAAGPWWEGEGEGEGEGEEEDWMQQQQALPALPILPPPSPSTSLSPSYSIPSSPPPPHGSRKPLTPRQWTLLASGKQLAEQQNQQQQNQQQQQ